jgi:hypothetical protein
MDFIFSWVSKARNKNFSLFFSVNEPTYPDFYLVDIFLIQKVTIYIHANLTPVNRKLNIIHPIIYFYKRIP